MTVHICRALFFLQTGIFADTCFVTSMPVGCFRQLCMFDFSCIFFVLGVSCTRVDGQRSTWLSSCNSWQDTVWYLVWLFSLGVGYLVHYCIYQIVSLLRYLGCQTVTYATDPFPQAIQLPMNCFLGKLAQGLGLIWFLSTNFASKVWKCLELKIWPDMPKKFQFFGPYFWETFVGISLVSQNVAANKIGLE